MISTKTAITSEDQFPRTQKTRTMDGAQVQASQPDSPTPLPYDPKEQLQDFNWDDLEGKFQKDIESCEKEEQRLYKEFHILIKV
jgi:hypothetical protein